MTPPDSRIASFRPLSQAETDLINKIKLHAKAVGELVEELRSHYSATPLPWPALGTKPTEVPATCDVPGPAVDQRWIDAGALQLQQGFMALTRAVAQPSHF